MLSFCINYEFSILILWITYFSKNCFFSIYILKVSPIFLLLIKVRKNSFQMLLKIWDSEISIYIVFKFVKFCFYCWNSAVECQISNKRVTSIANSCWPLPTLGGGGECRLAKFPPENFPIFYEKQTGLCAIQGLLWKRLVLKGENFYSKNFPNHSTTYSPYLLKINFI